MGKFFTTENYKQIISLIAVAGLFILASFFTRQNIEEIRPLILRGGIVSIIVYIFVGIVATVLAPLTSIPLIPLAVQVWGIFLTSVLSIIGWGIGSLGAFWVARTFGASIVSKIESLERIKKIADGIPKKRIFWYLIFLRITIPVDILSYALGLFTNISWKMFLATTFIGIIPMTFLFSYVGSLPIEFQLPLVVFGIVVVISLFYFHSRKKV